MSFDLHRRRLTGLAYRMLGSRADAEDVVQEAALRWAKADRNSIDDIEGWLVTVTSRIAVDLLRKRSREREVYVGPWLPEPVDEPAADTPALAESLRLAFLLMLERLTPAERAAFLMREVFDSDYADIAGAIGCTPEAARQHVSRAKRRVADGRGRFAVAPDAETRLMGQFSAAIASNDYAAMLSILAPDAEAWSDGGGKALAARNVVHGADKVARFLLGISAKNRGQLQFSLTEANGGPALIARGLDGFETLVSIATDGARITGVFLQRNPDKLGAFARH